MARYIITQNYSDFDDNCTDEYVFEGTEEELKKAILADIYDNDWEFNEYESPDDYFDNPSEENYWREVTRTLKDFVIRGPMIYAYKNNYEIQISYTAIPVDDKEDLSSFKKYNYSVTDYDKLMKYRKK
jgi:hypothetical protein